MDEHTKIIDNYFSLLKNTVDSLDRNEIKNFVDQILNIYNQDKTIYIFGNGGSALTASHFAGDINKGVCYGMEKRFKIIPLVDNIFSLTAYANDVDYNDVFIEQLKNFLNYGDMVIGISGSGNSENIIRAIEYANSKGNITFGITGYDGGKLKKIAKFSLNANINNMQISEDIHMILGHLVMHLILPILKPDKKVKI